MAVVSWWRIVTVCVLIVVSGFFAGLTLGTMSLDVLDLRVLAESGTEREKRCARRILPVRKRANFLLCSLLIGNTAANSALSIVSADLFGGLKGFLASTILILYLGEIIPQALCHRYSLYIGSYSVPIIKLFMALTAIVSYPTSRILDYFLGSEPATRYNKSQLRSLVSIHAQHHQNETDDETDGAAPDDLYSHAEKGAAKSPGVGSITRPENGTALYAVQHTKDSYPLKPVVVPTGAAVETASPVDEAAATVDSLKGGAAPHARSAPPGLPPLAGSPSPAESLQPAHPSNRLNEISTIPEDSAMFFSPATIDERQARSPGDNPQLTVRGTKLRQFLFGRRNRGSDVRGVPTPGTGRRENRDRLASLDNENDKDGLRSRDRNSDGEPRPLTRDEMTMLGGAFDFAHKNVVEVMTPVDRVFMLDANLLLNFEIMLLIFQSGHSRIPVYEGSRRNIVGVLFTKDLILLDPEDSVPIKTVLLFFNRKLLLVRSTLPLDEMLNIFKSGGGHLALVHTIENKGLPNQPREILGLVTLEDLIEELIGQDIVDETDVFTNNISRKRVSRARSIDPDILKMFDGTKTDETHRLTDKEVKVVAAYLSNNFDAFSPSIVTLQVLEEMLPEARTVEYPELSKADLVLDVVPSQGEGPADSLDSALVVEPYIGDHQSDIGDPALQTSATEPRPEDAKIQASSTPQIARPPGSAVTPTHQFVTSLLQYTSGKDTEIKEAEGINPSGTVIYKRAVPTYAAYLVINGKLEVTAGDEGFLSEIGPWTLLGVKALTSDLYAPDFTARVSERPTRLLQIRRRLYRRMVRYSTGGVDVTAEEQTGRESGPMEDAAKSAIFAAETNSNMAPAAVMTRVTARSRGIQWSELETGVVNTSRESSKDDHVTGAVPGESDAIVEKDDS
jgi:CBS domain containing-hemolysin-like protein